jgi:uncharacterized metal-binding protein
MVACSTACLMAAMMAQCELVFSNQGLELPYKFDVKPALLYWRHLFL